MDANYQAVRFDENRVLIFTNLAEDYRSVVIRKREFYKLFKSNYLHVFFIKKNGSVARCNLAQQRDIPYSLRDIFQRCKIELVGREMVLHCPNVVLVDSLLRYGKIFREHYHFCDRIQFRVGGEVASVLTIDK